MGAVKAHLANFLELQAGEYLPKPFGVGLTNLKVIEKLTHADGVKYLVRDIKTKAVRLVTVGNDLLIEGMSDNEYV